MYDRALEYYQKDLKIQQIILGDDNPGLASSYNNLGTVYKNLKLFDNSIQCFEESLKLKKRLIKNTENN